MARRRMRRTYGVRHTRKGTGRTSWVTNIFNEGAQTIDGTLTEYALLEYGDYEDPATNLHKPTHIKRIILKGGLAYTPQSTTFAQDIGALFMALYVIDQNDADGTILTVATSGIVIGNRVLHLDCMTRGLVEIPAAQASQVVIPEFRIDLDIRLNVTMLPDEALSLGLQFGSSVVETIAVAAFSGYCKVLIEQP